MFPSSNEISVGHQYRWRDACKRRAITQQKKFVIKQRIKIPVRWGSNGRKPAYSRMC